MPLMTYMHFVPAQYPCPEHIHGHPSPRYTLSSAQACPECFITSIQRKRVDGPLMQKKSRKKIFYFNSCNSRYTAILHSGHQNIIGQIKRTKSYSARCGRWTVILVQFPNWSEEWTVPEEQLVHPTSGGMQGGATSDQERPLSRENSSWTLKGLMWQPQPRLTSYWRKVAGLISKSQVSAQCSSAGRVLYSQKGRLQMCKKQYTIGISMVLN